MPLVVVLRSRDGEPVRDLPDPSGGTFDACGDFDDMLPRSAGPLLSAIDPYDDTTLESDEMPALLSEVDALLGEAKGRAAVPGERGSAWRGLSRLRVMATRCGDAPGSALVFYGD